MARNFLQYPFAPYQGGFSSKPFNDRRGQIKGLLVTASIVWPLYNVGGNPLGNSNPNFTINVNLNSAGPNTVSQNWTIQSVYIDNEAVNFPVYVFFPSTGASVSCPPNSSGWFQVFTIDRVALIIGLGISDLDIANDAQTNVFFTDASMVPYLDQENQTAVQMGLASPSINLGSSGGQLKTIGIVLPGSNYANGNLTISGGGGAGATAQGTIDQYGRFISVKITNPGAGFTGFPVITPTAAQNLIAAWNGATLYQPGNLSIYSGLIYLCTFPVQSNVPPPSNPSAWSSTGIVVPATATFNSTFSAITGGGSIVASSNFGTFALGDQSKNYVSNAIAANGVFQHNLFGTPFGSGFIYITNLFVNQLNSTNTSDLWQLEDANGDVLWNFQSLQSGMGQIASFDRGNVKIPATIEWRLNMTGFTAPALDLAHLFNWTYAQF